MRIVFIVNPIAGRKKQPIAEVLRSCFREGECDIRTWSRPDEIGAIIDTVGPDVDVVCAVGGDGTVHEVGKRLAHTPHALGIIPTGSGNGLARHLHIPLDPREAVETARHGQVAAIDLARVNGDAFLGICGIGFDAVVARRFAQAGTRGLETYVREGMRTYISYAAERYRFVLDDESFETEAFLVAVANSGQYGNDARIAPFASLQDGLLDVAIVTDGSLLRAPILLYRLFTGTLKQSDAVLLKRAKRIIIERERRGPAHIDGEPVILPPVLEFEVDPLALRVRIPQDLDRF
jgi:diacylglycerol kinase (ATP)